MRIVSGCLRGKNISAPDGSATRPTSDRAREALFNIIYSLLLKQGRLWSDISFVDVFAGSGAVGIEAFSRGARAVRCFENDKRALAVLRQNAGNLNGIVIMERNALTPPPGEEADILFMDAPYGKGLWQQALSAFDSAGYIGAKTIVIIETDKNLKEQLPEKYDLIQDRAAGRNRFLFAQKRIED